MAKKPSTKKSPAAQTTPKAKAVEEDLAAPETEETRKVEDEPRDEVAAKPAPTEPLETPPSKPEQATESALGNLGWAVGVLLLGIGILVLLAQLPPLE